jgi:hypothetical protein
MSGILQELIVASDTEQNLRLALSLPFQWNSILSHYKFGARDGFSWIEFCSYGYEATTPLPFPIKSPDDLFNFVSAWLKSALRGDEVDYDGSSTEGWQVSKGTHYSSVIRVETKWIEYHK